MFIIEKQELNKYEWNNDKMTMQEVTPYFYTPCGSSFTILCNDLKTIRGVLNRYKNWIYSNNYGREIKRVVIYKCNAWLQDTTKLQPIHIIELNK